MKVTDPNEIGKGLQREVERLTQELDSLHAHLRAVVANINTDPDWTGVVPALEGLIPGTDAYNDGLIVRLRESGLTNLAQRLEDR